MKSGSSGIAEIVPAGISKWRSASDALLFTRSRCFAHHAAKGPTAVDGAGGFLRGHHTCYRLLSCLACSFKFWSSLA